MQDHTENLKADLTYRLSNEVDRFDLDGIIDDLDYPESIYDVDEATFWKTVFFNEFR